MGLYELLPERVFRANRRICKTDHVGRYRFSPGANGGMEKPQYMGPGIENHRTEDHGIISKEYHSRKDQVGEGAVFHGDASALHPGCWFLSFI